MSDSNVLAHRDGGVLLLTLNRPERNNAWTYEMGDRYFDLLDEADNDPDVRVIVVTASGSKSFCVGMDAQVLSSGNIGPGKRMPAKDRRMTHALSVRKPLIAAINGGCAGFGLVQALHCDVRFAADHVVFSTAFVQRGLNAEYGSSWLLPRIIGHARAMEWLLSSRRMDAAEAERIGLIHRLIPSARLLEETMKYAQAMATNCSPIAMADAKQQVRHDWLAHCTEAEDFAKELGHSPGHRVDFGEGIASLMEKRPPRFAPLPPR